MEIDFEQQLAQELGVAEDLQASQQQEQTEAAAETQTEPEGANEQETAEPAAGTEGEQTGEQQQKVQTLEERRANAERRRKHETQVAVDAAREEERARAKAEMDAFFRNAGMKNSFTGEDITTREEFDAWQKQYKSDQKDKALQSGKLTQEVLDQMMEDTPVMQKVQELLEQQKAQPAAQQEDRALTQEEQASIQQELQEIQKLNPDVKGIQDILKMDTAERFIEMVDQGCNYVEAYKIANHDAIVKQEAQAVAKAAADAQMRKARGKEHLVGAHSTRGPGSLTISSEQMAYFRAVMPEATDQEIQAFWDKDQKKFGR